jgi:hypothetical protein
MGAAKRPAAAAAKAKPAASPKPAAATAKPAAVPKPPKAGAAAPPASAARKAGTKAKPPAAKKSGRKAAAGGAEGAEAVPASVPTTATAAAAPPPAALDALVNRHLRVAAPESGSSVSHLCGVVLAVNKHPRKRFNVHVQWQPSGSGNGSAAGAHQQEWVRLDVAAMELTREGEKGKEEPSACAFEWAAQPAADQATAPGAASGAAAPAVAPAKALAVAPPCEEVGAQHSGPAQKKPAQEEPLVSDADTAPAVVKVAAAPQPDAPSTGGAPPEKLEAQRCTSQAPLPPPRALALPPEELMKTTAAKYKQRTEELKGQKRPAVLLDEAPRTEPAKKRKDMSGDGQPGSDAQQKRTSGASGVATGGGAAYGGPRPGSTAPSMPAAGAAAQPAQRHERIIRDVGPYAGAIIGTGGRTVKEIQAMTGATVRLDDTKTVATITATTEAAVTKAVEQVEAIIERAKRAPRGPPAQQFPSTGQPPAAASMPECLIPLAAPRGPVPHADAFRGAVPVAPQQAGPGSPPLPARASQGSPSSVSASQRAYIVPPAAGAAAAVAPAPMPSAHIQPPAEPLLPLPDAPELSDPASRDALAAVLALCEKLRGSSDSIAAVSKSALESSTLPGFPEACIHALAARIDSLAVSGAHPKLRLYMFYILDSIAQNSLKMAQKHSAGTPKNEAAATFVRTILSLLGHLIPRVAPPGPLGREIRPKVGKVLAVWSDRGVVPPEQLARYAAAIDAQLAEDQLHPKQEPQQQPRPQQPQQHLHQLLGLGGGSPVIATLLDECELWVANEYGTAAAAGEAGHAGGLALHLPAPPDIDALDAALVAAQRQQAEQAEQAEQAAREQQREMQRQAEQALWEQQLRQPAQPLAPPPIPPPRPPPFPPPFPPPAAMRPLPRLENRQHERDSERDRDRDGHRGRERERERERHWEPADDGQRRGVAAPPPLPHWDNRYQPPYAQQGYNAPPPVWTSAPPLPPPPPPPPPPPEWGSRYDERRSGVDGHGHGRQPGAPFQERPTPDGRGRW